jgi:hypothetical protein
MPEPLDVDIFKLAGATTPSGAGRGEADAAEAAEH